MTAFEQHPADPLRDRLPSRMDSAGALLNAGPEHLCAWMLHRPLSFMAICVFAIVIGAGVYGATMGLWRSPLQALFTGIKLPLVILLTTLGNSLLNGMLAPLLGLNLTFRQSLTMVLMSFAFVSVMLGALSPVAWFVVWNTPPLTAAMQLSSPEYGVMQLALVGFIALAGVAGNAHLLPLLSARACNRRAAQKVLFAWLAGNLFLGSQIAWVLRPFSGTQPGRWNLSVANIFTVVFSRLFSGRRADCYSHEGVLEKNPGRSDCPDDGGAHLAAVPAFPVREAHFLFSPGTRDLTQSAATGGAASATLD